MSEAPGGRWPIRPQDAAGRNMLLLAQLRWLAILGQGATILAVHYALPADLPLRPLFAVLMLLVVVNLGTLAAMRHNLITSDQLFGALLLDVAALTVELYLTGGANNPFVSLYLLQVVLGAVLLEAIYGWALVAVTALAFTALIFIHQPLILPRAAMSSLSPAYFFGAWVAYVLAAVLLVAFITRINANLRARAAHLAALRERAAEEEQIVRMGLLASGAAHELGTPLASLAVILGDWRNEPAVAGDPRLADELADMQAQVARCKTILAGILRAAGEVAGIAPERTTLAAFLTATLAPWQALHPDVLSLDDRTGVTIPIIADRALGQAIINLLDNAVEAGAARVTLTVTRADGRIRITARDNGSGFAPPILDAIGKPYQTTRPRAGAGLGLFLAVNALRQLGGRLEAANQPAGGAEVTLDLPLGALAHGAER